MSFKERIEAKAIRNQQKDAEIADSVCLVLATLLGLFNAALLA